MSDQHGAIFAALTDKELSALRRRMYAAKSCHRAIRRRHEQANRQLSLMPLAWLEIEVQSVIRDIRLEQKARE